MSKAMNQLKDQLEHEIVEQKIIHRLFYAKYGLNRDYKF